jgi:serine phosphatase RsbU (regulator of sigma subunit)
MLVSDGIFEATNVSHDQLGIERMCQTLDEHQHQPPTEVLAALRESVRRWHGKQDPLDDQTIVIVQREGSPQPVVREGEHRGGETLAAGA